LQVEAGHWGGQWELDRDEAAVDFMEDLVRSVVAGRVVEVFGPGRSRVEVTLSDGSRAVETGGDGLRGLLPSPGWKSRGHRIRYAPYSA
jgi:hypothetical protein